MRNLKQTELDQVTGGIWAPGPIIWPAIVIAIAIAAGGSSESDSDDSKSSE